MWRLPWIARSSHEAIVRLLQDQIVGAKAELAELKAERTVLYDRLGSLGLGGPLFKVPAEQQEAEQVEEPETMEDRINQILAQKRRPGFLARAIKKLAIEEMNKRGPEVKWVPSTVAALDEAEAGIIGDLTR